jgi:CRP/FNR family transcriptional regulator
LSVKDVVKSQTFFSSLNDEELEELVSISLLHHYKKEYILQYENINCNELFFLIDGLAKAYKIDKHDNEIFLYYIYGNSMISEISDIDSDNLRSFSNIKLIDDSRILSINYNKFKEIFLNKNRLCKDFTREILNKSQQLQSLINREFVFDAISKVSMMLYEDLQMFNKLKRQDISQMLHIQPATLSRVLNRLKRDNIIDIIHGRVIVVDAKILQEIYKDRLDE